MFRNIKKYLKNLGSICYKARPLYFRHQTYQHSYEHVNCNRISVYIALLALNNMLTSVFKHEQCAPNEQHQALVQGCNRK